MYSFNVYKTLSGYGTYGGYFSVGPFSPGDPAFLVILGFFTYLALFRDRRYSIAVGLVSFFALSYFPGSTLIIGEEFLVLFLFLFAYRWFGVSKQKPGETHRKSLLDGAAVLAAIAVANAYLLLPFVLTGGTYTSAISSSNPSYTYTFGFDTIETAANSIRLISNWFVATPDAPSWVGSYLGSPLPILLTWALPVLALTSIVFVRRRIDLVLYAGMLTLVFASTGPYPPSGPVYVALVTGVPLLRGYANPEYFSPIMVILYGLFASFTIAEVASRVSTWGKRQPRSEPVTCGKSRRHRAFSSIVARYGDVGVAIALTGLLIGSAYPAITPAYSVGSPGYPSSSSLPGSYLAASNYLQGTNPWGPVMVFPDVSPFTSLITNNTTWYSGPDTYSTIIANPSISSDLPANYWGTQPGTMAIPSFVYRAIGTSACPVNACTQPGVNLIPQLASVRSNESGELVTQNSSGISWESTTAGDALNFEGPGGGAPMVFSVNTSNYVEGGHWAIGYFNHTMNLSEDNYALITMAPQDANVSDLQFGYHSGSKFGAGDAYLFSKVTRFLDDGAYTFLIPLKFPSLSDNGTLSNITNLFFVYQSPQSEIGFANFQIESIRLSSYSGPLAFGWTPTDFADNSTLVSTGAHTTLRFEIDQTASQSGVHWDVGELPTPIDISNYSFAVINYTEEGLNPALLQFGYHTVPGQSGDAYVPENYLTSGPAGGVQTTYIDLTQPTLTSGGELRQVRDVFFNYAGSSASPIPGYLNVSSITLVAGEAGGTIMASDLARLGVEFAYVDAAIQGSATPSRVGPYYNELLSSSSDFSRVFARGTITIYRDDLYKGVISVSNDTSLLPLDNATIGGESFSYAEIYDNSSNSGVTYLSAPVQSPTGSLGQAIILSATVDSPTQFRATIRATGWSILTARLSYSQQWMATIDGGSSLGSPIMIDGFANGWLAPPGNYTVTISLNGQDTFQAVELVAFMTPPIMMGLLLVASTWRRVRGPAAFLDRFLGSRRPRIYQSRTITEEQVIGGSRH